MIFVLIHGAWQDSTVWQRVQPLLEQQGQQVHALDLPGHGKHIADAQEIYLTNYIDYVSDYIKTLATKVVLVGHSFAGIIISGVVAKNPELIQRLIYIAAFIPQHKKSLLRIAENFTSGNPGLPLQFNNDKKQISLELPKGAELLYHDCATENFERISKNLQAEPMTPFMEPVDLPINIYQQIPCHFILCRNDKTINITDQRSMLPNTNAKVTELESGHSPFYAAPEALVAALL